MPKPMLNSSQVQIQSNTVLSTAYSPQKQQSQQTDKMKLDRLLRKPRSKQYMDAIHRLDAGGHTHNQNKVDDIINNIRNEFPEVQLSSVMLGIVSVCYLGHPYEVHTLDMSGQIIEHFEAGRQLPEGMEKARAIALHGGYDFIEVYADCCRAISSNGSVSVINC